MSQSGSRPRQRRSRASTSVRTTAVSQRSRRPTRWVCGTRRTSHDIVDPLPPGEQPHVRQLPTSAEIRALYERLTENGTLATPPTYPGTSHLLEDGTRISIRETSSSGGTTIDIKYPDGSIQKVHLPPGRRATGAGARTGIRLLGHRRRDRDRYLRRARIVGSSGHVPASLALFLRLGEPLVQPRPDVVGGVRIPLPLITRHQRATSDDAGDTGHANPLPDAPHARQCA